MKAFEFKKDSGTWVQDMEAIMNYLLSKGKVNVSENKVQELYSEYSEQMWSAGWMEVNDTTLNGFAFWLSKYEI